MITTVVVIAVAAIVRFICALVSSKMSFLSSKTVKKTLREKIYKKLLKLGSSYRENVQTMLKSCTWCNRGGAFDSAHSSVSYAVSLLLCEKLREAAQLVHIYEALQEESREFRKRRRNDS